MEQTVVKIALAGLLHDIGKFAERASPRGRVDVDDSRAGFFPAPGFLEDNAALYQPFDPRQQRHTHRHAVFTAAFIDHLRAILPDAVDRPDFGEGDPLINLAAGHHHPQTPMQWVVAVADRLASGLDRSEFEREYQYSTEVADYRRVRLLPVLATLDPDRDEDRSLDPGSVQHRLPLAGLSPEGLVPRPTAEVESQDDTKAEAEYRDLFFEFVAGLEALEHKRHPELWLQHLDSLLAHFTSQIPAATVGRVIADVSLHDHARMVAALAPALYLWHRERGSLTVEAVRDTAEPRFLFVRGEFLGIQSFIFAEGGQTNRNAARLLRGRSFAVSLMVELAADRLLRRVGLPRTSVLIDAAGQFVAVLPNTEAARQAVTETEAELAAWLLRHFHGQCAITLAAVAAGDRDLGRGERGTAGKIAGGFADFYRRLLDASAERKGMRFDLAAVGGARGGYLDQFDNTLDPSVCPFCDHRPSSRRVADRPDDMHGRVSVACTICRDQIVIGRHLVGRGPRLAVTTAQVAPTAATTLEPIFGHYQVIFGSDERLADLAGRGELVRCWDLTSLGRRPAPSRVTRRLLNGYVPVCTDDDANDERVLAGRKSDRKKEELIIEPGDPLTFSHLGAFGLREDPERPGRYLGVEALGVLKADVDQLGLLLSYGLDRERRTPSRYATLSRQLDQFFTVLIPDLLGGETGDGSGSRFRHVYTVFAGGDDLFLIGAWHEILTVACVIRERFVAVSGGNPKVHLSAGISIGKPGEPVRVLAERAESLLEHAKHAGRDRIALFETAMPWDDYVALHGVIGTVEEWLEKRWVNPAMLYRLLDLTEQRRQEQALRPSGDRKVIQVKTAELDCLLWRSRLRYSAVRTVGWGVRMEKQDRLAAIDEVIGKSQQWLEKHGGGLRAALWPVAWRRRRVGR